MNWRDARWLVIDLETTGLNPETADPVQVGLLWMQDGIVLRSDSFLVRPPSTIPPEATAIHGIGDEAVAGCPTIAESGDLIRHALSECDVMLGYNAIGYDFPILARVLPNFRSWCRGKVVLDPLVVIRFDSVGRWWKGVGRHRLAEAARRSGLDVDESKTHSAIYDCELAGALMWCWRDQLPADGKDAQRLTVSAQREQDADFKRWLAKQPKRDTQEGNGA